MTNKQEPQPWENALVLAAIIISCVLVILCAAGCCAQKEIVKHQTDTLYVQKIQVDSVYRRDSVLVREKGDTVYIYKEKIRDRYRLLRDTVRIVKIDTVETLKEVEVEQPLTLAQQVRLRAFSWLLWGCILLLVWTFRKPLLKLLKI